MIAIFLQHENARVYHPNSEIKAAIVERVNLSLQRLIYQYLIHNQSNKYFHILPKLVQTYNSRPHRSLDGLSPNQAELPENRQRVEAAFNKRFDRIKRIGLRRVITVSSNVLTGFTPDEVVKSVEAELEGFDLPTGAEIKLTGESEDQEE